MPTGIRDVERRERIARAAIDVVADRGVEGLSYRAVAEAAGVPLGSTTYYFETLESLLDAAVSTASDISRDRFDEWSRGIGDEDELPSHLATLLLESTGPQREWTVVEYELYVAALRRPRLRKLGMEWGTALEGILARHVDGLTAAALAAAANGLTLQSLISGVPLERAEVEPVLRRVVAG